MNDKQAVIQSSWGFCVVDIQLKRTVFKYNLKEKLSIDLTISHHAVAVPRLQNGIIVQMGDADRAQKCFDTYQARSSKDKKCCYKDMNHIYKKFEHLFFS